MNPLLFCQACTDYSSVPTKPQHHTRHESSCTAATEQSFSSLVWTVSTIHTAAHISTPVTGHYSDISQQYCVNPRIIGTAGGELFDKIIERTTPSGCLFGVEAARIIKSIVHT